MRPIHLNTLILLAGLASLALPARALQQTTVEQAGPERTAAQPDAEPTPAQKKIARAQLQLAQRPGDIHASCGLAMGLARRARETADPAYYDQAQEVLQAALLLHPGHFNVRKILIWVQLGRHEFESALKLATELNRRVPDDPDVYGFLTDANVELGRYDEAEEACQWMLDMQPGSPSALTRASYLRELFGDVEGALELMRIAYDALRPSEVEDRAWILTQMAHLEFSRGQLAEAERYAEIASELFQDYHYALRMLARVRRARGEHGAGIELLERRRAVAPHPENLFDVAVALEASGASAQAQPLFERFEIEALAESENLDNANRELIEYYLEHAAGDRAADGLAMARRLTKTRRDVDSLELLAWALHANDQDEEAQRVAEEMLAVGVRHPRKLYRAAAIAASAGRLESAKELVADCLARCPYAECATSAAELLAELEKAAD